MRAHRNLLPFPHPFPLSLPAAVLGLAPFHCTHTWPKAVYPDGPPFPRRAPLAPIQNGDSTAPSPPDRPIPFRLHLVLTDRRRGGGARPMPTQATHAAGCWKNEQ